MAHIGVLRALEEARVPIDCIAGTSAGAVIGGLYAAGHPPDRIEEIMAAIDWNVAFGSRPDRRLRPVTERLGGPPALLRVGFDRHGFHLPQGAFSDHRVNRVLAEHLAGPGFRAGGDFDRLRVPFRAVATDLETADRVVLASGPLDRAVRASMSVPVALVPVPWGGRLLVDGGLVDNLPVGAARDMGADVVIAVDATSPPSGSERLRDAVGIASHLTEALGRAQNAVHRREADVTVKPDLRGLTFWDYGRLREIVDLGQRATAAAMGELSARLGAAAGAGRAMEPEDDGGGLEDLPLAGVEVRGQRVVRARVVRDAFRVVPGPTVRMHDLLHGLDHLYAAGAFVAAWLGFEPAPGGGAVLVLNVHESDARLLELGLSHDEADEVEARVRVLMRSALSRGEQIEARAWASNGGSGLEARASAERRGASPVGLRLRVALEEDKPRVFVGGEFRARARFERRLVEAAAFRALGHDGHVVGGFAMGQVETSARLGLDWPEARDRLRSLFAEAAWDTLDDASLPTRGVLARAAFERTLPGLGATRDVWRTEGRVRLVAPLRARTVASLEGRLGLSRGDVAPYDRFRLGGPDDLPGLHREERWGSQVLAASAGISRLLWGGLRATARVGFGGVWSERRQVSAGDLEGGFALALERATPVGPALLGWGRGPAGSNRIYATIGFR
jgi:NTE family protein